MHLVYLEVNMAHTTTFRCTLKPINQIIKYEFGKEDRAPIATSCLLSGYNHISYTHTGTGRSRHKCQGVFSVAMLCLYFGTCGLHGGFPVISLKSRWWRMVKAPVRQPNDPSQNVHGQSFFFFFLHFLSNHSDLLV
jgi:hypothetical protein